MSLLLIRLPFQSSALQRVGLADAVEWRNEKDGTVSGSPSVTFFAPTNKAFDRLPKKLKLFLFSPFGEPVLKKLLQYHIAPEFVLHSGKLTSYLCQIWQVANTHHRLHSQCF